MIAHKKINRKSRIKVEIMVTFSAYELQEGKKIGCLDVGEVEELVR